MKMHRATRLTYAWLVVAATVASTGLHVPPSRAAGLLIADGGFGGVLEIKEHTVRVTINNNVAVTEVNQVFVNTENRQVEALYTFPVPKRASISNFSMWINGKEMIGEVVEKERAREIYNSYKRQRRDPGLLEQVDYKTFEMRIFPIAPRAEQRVQITYYQELDTDHDWATYVYPLATVTRSNIDQRTTGRFALSLEAKSEIPIVSMHSPNHTSEFVIVPQNDGYYQASIETTGGDLSRDVVLSYQVSRPATGIDFIASNRPGEDGYVCVTLTTGMEVDAHDLGMDYVFVLDVSGSMRNDGKLHVSRGQLEAFINALSERDRFDIIAFNIDPTTLFNRLEGVSEDTRARADEFLASQEARGGTVLTPALSVAYKYRDPDRSLNVVVLSDGMTEQGERRSLLELIRSRPENTRVFCIGVGNEVNRPLLEQVAEDTGGLAAFLSRGDDFDRQAKAFIRKLVHPVATNVRIAFEGLEVYDLEPPTLPNLYHGSPIRLYGRYAGSGQALVRVQAFIDGRLIDWTAEVDLPEIEDQNPEIERMWAWHKVRRLLKEADRTGSRRTTQDEVVRLGEAYSIATEYTSFIVLENDREYKRWKIERRNALRIKRDRRSRDALQARLQELRSEALSNLGPVSPPQRLASANSNGVPATNSTNTGSQQRTQPPRQQGQRDRWGDGLGGGGGAFDPFSAVAAVSLAGWAASRIRRRRRTVVKGR